MKQIKTVNSISGPKKRSSSDWIKPNLQNSQTPVGMILFFVLLGEGGSEIEDMRESLSNA